MKNKLKNISQNLLMILLGTIMSFIAAEIFLRIYNPFAFRVKGDKIVLSANEKYIVKNENATKLDKTIMLHTNSLGFRGEEPPDDFDKHLTTVTIGGSTTECSLLTEGKTWTDVLGKHLQKAFRNIWINNAGLDGHSTYGHVVMMEDYVAELKPDNVLFLVGINDEGNNEKGRDFEDDKTILKDEAYFMSLKGIGRALSNNSEFFAVLLNFYRYYMATVVGVDHNTELDLNRSLVLELPEEVKQRAIEKHKKFLKSYEMRILKLIRISRSNGIEPVFITQPALYGNVIDPVTNIDLAIIYKRSEENGALAWERLELYNDVVRQTGEKENVLVIDLAREMPKDSRYYYDFSHYTNEGAEKVAEIIFNSLCPFYTKKYSGFLVKDCNVNGLPESPAVSK
ncbi:MAG: hypothetical protein C4560_03510 [Nitrospiraceae bacterium]|nr:MAG: hypothetical protein C4560_03510 [Nitrospiraceae bacterium]